MQSAECPPAGRAVAGRVLVGALVCVLGWDGRSEDDYDPAPAFAPAALDPGQAGHLIAPTDTHTTLPA